MFQPQYRRMIGSRSLAISRKRSRTSFVVLLGVPARRPPVLVRFGLEFSISDIGLHLIATDLMRSSGIGTVAARKPDQNAAPRLAVSRHIANKFTEEKV